jgi:homoserine kinase type II
MAVYTEVGDAELDALLAEYDLGAPIAFKGIAEGVDNSNYFLATERGRFILTLYEKRVRADDLPWFLGLMEHLAARGFPAPAPVPGRDGRALRTVCARPATLVSFLDGMAVTRPQPQHCLEVGGALARLHQAAGDHAPARANDLGPQAWTGLWAANAARAAALGDWVAPLVEDTLAALSHWPTGLPRGIIHADLFPDNVFFRDGRFCAAIDFYFACNDLLAYDVAVCLNAWCFEADGSFNLTKGRALLRGHGAVRTLTDAEIAALPMLCRGAALRFFLTRLADWQPPAPGVVVRPKDPMEYARKLAFHACSVPGDYGA